MAKTGDKTRVEIPVTFGNVSIGDGTARLGFTISRKNLKPAKAEQFLCNARLDVLIQKAPDDPDQGTIEGLDEEPLHAIGDSAGFGTYAKRFSGGLTFALGEIDVREIAGFAKAGQGTLRVLKIGAVPEKKKQAELFKGEDGDGADDEGEHAEDGE